MNAEDGLARDGLPSVRITRGTPNEEDLAALAGVLPAAYLEEAENATADEPTAQDAWSRARRMRRSPEGRWGRFSG